MVKGSIELNKIQIQSFDCVLVHSTYYFIASLHEILKKSLCFKMILVLNNIYDIFLPTI